MKRRHHLVLYSTAFLLVALATPPQLEAQGTTAFNFQGFLEEDDKAVTGTFDCEFALFDGPDPFIDQLIGIEFLQNVTVLEGIFNVILDYGPGIFDGRELWLRTCLREAGGGALMCLDPLHRIMPVPYATFAINASELQGLQPDDFLRRTSGCEICLGHADSNGPEPESEVCFDLSSNGQNNSNFIQLDGNVDDNDRLWLWMSCP